jgi:hypothetical protein
MTLNENRNGWIKIYRKDLDLLRGMSDPEYRYYQTSLLLAVWDSKKSLFGEFDARTVSMRKHFDWSSGKINETKNSLLKKGYYTKQPNHRLRIKNPKYHFGKDRDIEKQIHHYEGDFHTNEGILQRNEDRVGILMKDRDELAKHMTIPWE